MAARLSPPGFLVQQQLRGGLELIVGGAEAPGVGATRFVARRRCVGDGLSDIVVSRESGHSMGEK